MAVAFFLLEVLDHLLDEEITRENAIKSRREYLKSKSLKTFERNTLMGRFMHKRKPYHNQKAQRYILENHESVVKNTCDPTHSSSVSILNDDDTNSCIMPEEIEDTIEPIVETQQTLRRKSAFDFPSEEFRKMFKLSLNSVIKLCEELQGVLQPHKRSTAIPLEEKVLASLRFFVVGGHQKNIGKELKVNMSQPSVSRSVLAISKAICENFFEEKVIFPFEDSEQLIIKENLANMTGFPGVIGIVGFTHISIFSPPYSKDKTKDNLHYYNREKYHSLNCLLVCDANMKILYAYTITPGATYDSEIWYNSDLRKKLKEKYVNGTRHSWLIGGQSLPLEPWLLTPFTDYCTESPEERYNMCHTNVLEIFENCIKRLKRTFGCLKKAHLLHYSPEMASNIIRTCIFLHNILIDNEISGESDSVDEDEESPVDEELRSFAYDVLGDGDRDDIALMDGYVTRQELIDSHFT